MTTPQNSGLSAEEIGEFRADLNQIKRELVGAAAVAESSNEYDRISRECQGKIKVFNDIKKERTEDINILIQKIEVVKVLNKQLFFLKERYMDEYSKKLTLN